MDSNGDGHVDEAEAKQLSTAMGETKEEAQESWDDMMMDMDTDHNGMVELHEWTEFYMRRVRNAPLKQVLTQMTTFRDEIRAWKEEEAVRAASPPEERAERRQTLERTAEFRAEARRNSANASAIAAAGVTALQTNEETPDDLALEQESQDDWAVREISPEVAEYRAQVKANIEDLEKDAAQLKEQLMELQGSMLGRKPEDAEFVAKQEEANKLEQKIDSINSQVVDLMEQLEQ